MCCIGAGLLIENSDLAMLQISLVMIGRLFGSFGFSLVYLYTLELYPTGNMIEFYLTQLKCLTVAIKKTRHLVNLPHKAGISN